MCIRLEGWRWTQTSPGKVGGNMCCPHRYLAFNPRASCTFHRPAGSPSVSPQHHPNTHRGLTVCKGLEHLPPLLIPKTPCLVDRPQAISSQGTKEEAEAWKMEAYPGAALHLRTGNDQVPYLRTHAYEGRLLLPQTPCTRTCPGRLLSTSVLIMPPRTCRGLS